MLLKEKLTKAWQDRRVACPSHLCRWSESETGWLFLVSKSTFLGYVDNATLWVSQGRLTFPKYLDKKRMSKRNKYIFTWW